MDMIGLFGFKSGREINKFEGVAYITAQEGTPVITDYCKGYIECDLKQSVDVGTHTMFIGDVVDAQVFKKDKPLTYAYYHQVKKGTAPKTAEPAKYASSCSLSYFRLLSPPACAGRPGSRRCRGGRAPPQ